MSSSTSHEGLDPERSQLAWEILSDKVEALVEAWESGDAPPRLEEYAAADSDAVRRFLLNELVKVDLEYRWQRRDLPKTIEQYAEEFPELGDGQIPVDLIYEEYHVRRMTGEEVRAEDYFERFPQQASQLGRLFGLDEPGCTTSLFSHEKADPIEVGETIDDFDLLTELGKGAFASVFLARQRSMQRLVALKVSADRGTEPQTMAQLDHPHIVRVFDQRLLPERKMRLLYMQYVQGGTLKGVVDLIRQIPPTARTGRHLLDAIDAALSENGESPPLDSRLRQRLANFTWPQAVCWIGSRLAAALDYAARHGILHRDVKPANVLLGADGTPKLVDFNISFSSKLDGVTPAAYFGGSLAYMSPEQLEAFSPDYDRTPAELDGRADTYSLAVVLWELLTATRPFHVDQLKKGWSQTLQDMIVARKAGIDAEAMANLPPDIAPGMEQCLLKALAADRDDRFDSSAEFARQLELCLRPEVQRLLRPRTTGWRQALRTKPPLTVAVLVAAGLLPNVITSVPNIQYNLHQLVEPIGESVAAVFNNTLLLPLNAIFYTTGFVIAFSMAWPVVTALFALRGSRTIDPSRMPWLRRRCLALGDIVFWTSLGLWLASGAAFPLAIRAKVGKDLALGLPALVHFGASQALCGTMASAMCFFLITAFAVRVIYPVLVQPDTRDDEDIPSLSRLSRRIWGYLITAAAVFLVTLTALGMTPTASKRVERAVEIGVVGVAGLVCLLLVALLARMIQRDLNALAAAVDPEGASLAGGTETLESFMSGTRR